MAKWYNAKVWGSFWTELWRVWKTVTRLIVCVSAKTLPENQVFLVYIECYRSWEKQNPGARNREKSYLELAAENVQFQVLDFLMSQWTVFFCLESWTFLVCLRQQPPVWQSVLILWFYKTQSQYIFVLSLDVTTYVIDKHDSVGVQSHLYSASACIGNFDSESWGM